MSSNETVHPPTGFVLSPNRTGQSSQNRVWKFALPMLVVAASAGYVWLERGWIASDDQIEAEAEADTTGVATPGAAPATSAPAERGAVGSPQAPAATAQTPGAGGVAQVEPASAAQFRDGEYRGPKSDAFYGYVEVVAVIKDGKLVRASARHVPRSSQASQYINERAVPKLNKEAVAAQSSDIDFITGATLTSKAFVQSLAGALAQARR